MLHPLTVCAQYARILQSSLFNHNLPYALCQISYALTARDIFYCPIYIIKQEMSGI